MAKRSRQITLVLLASTSIALAACKDDKNTQYAGIEDALFKDRAACEAVYPADDCAKNELFATEEHIKTAPKYANREECEAAHGPEACTPVPQQAKPSAPSVASNGTSAPANANSGTSNSFMPFMLGYMMGNTIGSRPAPVYAAPAPAGQPRPSTPAMATAGRTLATPPRPAAQVYGGARPPSVYGGGSSVSTPSMSKPAAPSISSSGVARGGIGSTGMSAGSSAS